MIASMSSWILSIAGVICLSVIVELILPNGQMNKYIKGIFAFIIILVIIMPVPKLIKMKIDLSNVFSTNEIVLQEEYLYQLNLDKIMSMKADVEKESSAQGYSNVVVSINADIFSSSIVIKSVYVDISRIGIKQNAPHKDIIEIRKFLASLIKSRIKIEEEKIYFNE